ncbi:MAG: ubiquinol-cytochrome c reductase iron-sulfur subunit [Thermoplasmata archaeon]
MAEKQGGVLDTFVYEDPRASLPVWYVEEGLVGREALLSHFQPGRGAAVAWRVETQSGNPVAGTGVPALLLMMEEKALRLPRGYVREDFVIQGLYAVFNCCPHLCCQPGWRFTPREAQRANLGYDAVYCPCHASQFDPGRLEPYQHPGRTGGEEGEYLGIYKVPNVGPADRGMPLIPIRLEKGKVVGQLKHPAWYRYQKFQGKDL